MKGKQGANTLFGVSLVEILAVMAALGILASLGAVSLGGSHEGGREVKLSQGTPIPAPSGMQLMGVAAPAPPNWLVHAYAPRRRAAALPQPVLEIRAPPAVTYAEAGGAMIAGAVDFSGGPEALIVLANAPEIPLDLQSSTHFSILWTYDGSDPSLPGDHGREGKVAGLAAGLHMGDPFAGGFDGQPVDYALPLWGRSRTLPIEAVARDRSGNLEDSMVVKREIGIERVALREPKILIAGGMVHLQLVTAFGDMPAGARIFYTTDGSDPIVENGRPVGATMAYTGPFGQGRDLCFPAETRARVFGPARYEHWFDASAAASCVAPATVEGGDPFFSLVCMARSFCGYSWFLIGGAGTIEGSSATVSGDVALGPGAAFQEMDHVAGNLIHHGSVGGGTSGESGAGQRDFAFETEAALIVATRLASLPPTHRAGKITVSTTIEAAATDGVNIVSVSGINLGGDDVLTLHGDRDDWFVINVANRFTLSAKAKIALAGGVGPEHVLFNVHSSVSLMSFTGDADVFPGTILIPNSDFRIEAAAKIQGALIGGGNSQVVAGDAEVTGSMPFGG